MGTSASKYGNYVGLLSAVLFIIAAFVMILAKNDSSDTGVFTSTAQYFVLGAGVFAIIAGILLLLKEGKFIEKIAAILIIALGAVGVGAKFMIDADMDYVLVIEILSGVSVAAMLASVGAEWVRGMKGLMDINIIFMALEIVFFVLMVMTQSIEITASAAVLVIGFWLAASLGLSMTALAAPAAKGGEIDPERKSAKRAQKEQAKKKEEEKKQQNKQEKLEAHKKEQAKKEEEKKKEQERQERHEKSEEKKEAHKEALKKDAPKATEKPAENPDPAEAKKEEKPNNDFMSKLVSSKDASKAAAGATTVAAAAAVEEEVVKEEPAPASVEESVKEEPVAEPEPVPVEEPAPAEEAPAPVEEPVKEEPVAEPEPVPVEEPAPAEAAAVAAGAAVAVAAAVDNEEDGEEDEDEILEDTFTDYSPEALVRRAAWNKGLRCRRDYGEYHIPVAFVKGKVAVYVQDPADYDTSHDAKLEEDGWVIIRYDINTITDGLDQGSEIAAAVKANIRAQKAAKKKKKPAKK